MGLTAEAAAEAIADAGLRREDIDGLITRGGVFSSRVAEYMGLRPKNFALSADLRGATSGCALTIASLIVTEGIADYIRHKHFEKDIEKLRPDPDKSSYKQAYTIAAAFIFWLEAHKDKDIVRKLNAASRDGSYKREMFPQLCGADVDALWKEFAASLKAR